MRRITRGKSRRKENIQGEGVWASGGAAVEEGVMCEGFIFDNVVVRIEVGMDEVLV